MGEKRVAVAWCTTGKRNEQFRSARSHFFKFILSGIDPLSTPTISRNLIPFCLLFSRVSEGTFDRVQVLVKVVSSADEQLEVARLERVRDQLLPPRKRPRPPIWWRSTGRGRCSIDRRGQRERHPLLFVGRVGGAVKDAVP